MSVDRKLIFKDENSKDIVNKLDSSLTLKSMLAATPIGVNVWNKDMINIMCNAHILKVFNIENGEEFLDRFYEFCPEFQPNGKTSEEMARINFELALKNGEHTFNWMHITPSGSRLPCEITLVKLENPADEIYVVGFIKDLRSEFDYEQNDTSYDFYFTDKIPKSRLDYETKELSDEWYFTIDLRTGNVAFYGKWWFSAFGENALITESKMFDAGLFYQQDVPIYQELMNDIKSGITNTYELRMLHDSGEYRYHRVTSKFIKDSTGMPVFAMGKGVDIHDQREFEVRSQKDLLTDCYNKISAEDIISDKLLSNGNANHVLFIIDIDDFKAINDNFGHFFGDEVLRDIAAGLKKAFRDIDTIARIGGDEFIVFVENLSDMDLISQKAEKILEVYRKTYSGEYKEYSVSGSVGVALFPRDGADYDELYQNADKALSQAKIQGKNRYMVYSNDINVGTTRSTTIIENANRMASSFFDYDLISAVFNILYEKNGSKDAINLTLSYLCEKYGADRSYIFETLDHGATLSNTFEYCKEGIGSEIDNLQNIPYEFFADFISKGHNDIIYSNDLRDTLEHDEAYKIMDDQGILSFVHAQVKNDDELTFFIGLDDCTKTRIWTEREINSLQYIGKLLSIILQGEHLRNELNELAVKNKNSADILDTSDNIVSVSDLKTHDLLYLNRMGRRLAGLQHDEELKGKKTYKLLHGTDEPCNFYTTHLLKEDEYYECTYYNSDLDSTFLLKNKLIQFNNNLARLEIATDISEIVELERSVSDKLADEQFIMSCVELLHSDKETRISIQSILEEVANYYDAERSYLFEVSKCGKFISNTYEFCRRNSQAYIENLQNLPIEELGFLLKKCKMEDSFTMNVDDADKNSLEYELMKMQELTNIMISSIKSNGEKITGFVGVDNPLKNKRKVSSLRTVAKFTAIFIDETELLAKLNNLSYYDTLTGIKNRHSYSLALKNIDMDIDSLGVLYVDIAGLSTVNDIKGVFFGDSILVKLSKILYEIFEEDVFRVGGDEFVVIAENVAEQEFESNIALLKEKLSRENDFKTSIGYTWNKNLKNSNRALNDLHNGESYSRILRENLEMEIAGGKYVVYLQPQVNLSSGKVESAEALIRRYGADGVIQPPVHFLPFYEKEGIISKIDEFVLETVCKTLRSWKNNGVDALPVISINCSRMTISEDGIIKRFSKICDKYDIEPSKLIIEITETIYGIDENSLSEIIKNFSDAGFVVSLDDFGSGYSNLNSIVTSDFNEIKIDMKIISCLHKDKKSKLLTKLTIDLCEGIDGLTSVAEGVEDKLQHDILCEMGCNVGQGYYYAKPMLIDEFLDKYLD